MVVCYTLNFFYRHDGEKIKMISNRKSGPGSLTFTALDSIKVVFIFKSTLFCCINYLFNINVSYSYSYIHLKIYLM